jgi:hypothetical protein
MLTVAILVTATPRGQATPPAMRVRDMKVPDDGKLTLASFLAACKADAYVPAKAEAGAPLKGANSFTEGQARDRALAWGATNLSSLAKDPDGIWRFRRRLPARRFPRRRQIRC